MGKREMKLFVRGLSRTIEKDIIDKIRVGKIPSQWDGHELRCYLEYRHSLSASMSIIKRESKSKRARSYKNTIIVNNL